MERWKETIQASCGKVRRCPGLVWRTMWEVGHDDPRRAVHSMKVGVALTLVSFLYFLEPLFKGVGQNASYAAITVVIALDYNVGATLRKGLNIGLGSVLSGSLAFLIQYIAEKTASVGRAVFIGVAVFLIGTASTYVRFIPSMKKNFDLAVLFFLLTFDLITLSSYRVTEVKNIALQVLYSIAIGCAICLLMTLFIFPIWSGEDLHKSTIHKLEGLSKSIQACAAEYFSDAEKEETAVDTSSVDEDPIYVSYKEVVDSKSQDETLAFHASWEPRHSRHCRYPWQQYVKVGAALRQFGYTIVALHGCLKAEIKNPKCCCAFFRDPCLRVAIEESKALMVLANCMRNRCHCSPEILSDHLHKALLELNIAPKSKPALFLGSSNDTQTLAASGSCGSCGEAKDEKSTANYNAVSMSSSNMTDTCVSQKEADKRNNNKNDNKGIAITRPQLSKISMTSLEFAEALPFAAFAHFLVESVARLDKVIEEVEELCRMAHFKEYQSGSECECECESDEVVRLDIETPGKSKCCRESFAFSNWGCCLIDMMPDRGEGILYDKTFSSPCLMFLPLCHSFSFFFEPNV